MYTLPTQKKTKKVAMFRIYKLCELPNESQKDKGRLFNLLPKLAGYCAVCGEVFHVYSSLQQRRPKFHKGRLVTTCCRTIASADVVKM